jgi:hypothetical protein
MSVHRKRIDYRGAGEVAPLGRMPRTPGFRVVLVERALCAATCECLPQRGALALGQMTDTLDLPNL